jgi:hypothetical protein
MVMDDRRIDLNHFRRRRGDTILTCPLYCSS